MGRSAPKGRRVTVKISTGGFAGFLKRDHYCWVKRGTAELFKLKELPEIPGSRKLGGLAGVDGKTYGSVRTKSYKVLLTRATTVGGVSVISVGFPVPGDVKILEAINFFRNLSTLIAGIVSPDGRITTWREPAQRSGGLKGPGGVPILPPAGGSGGPIDKAKRFVDDTGDLVKKGVDAYNDVAPVAAPILRFFGGPSLPDRVPGT